MDFARLPLRVFGLDRTVLCSEGAYESLREQWAWCAPNHALQRSIAPLSTAPAQRPEPPTDITHATTPEQEGDGADYTLTTSLTASSIGACVGQFIMLHSGAIANDDGKVAALVAASGTGKTTATRYLCTHGYGYLSDETLIVNDSGDILPYPKPLSVLIDPTKLGEKSQHGPDELGLKLPTNESFRLGPIILLKRLKDDDEDDGPVPRLEEVDLFEGLTQVLPQSSATPDIPNGLYLLAQLASRGGGIHQLVYREIETTTPFIEQAFQKSKYEQSVIHIAGTWPQGSDAPNRYEPRSPAHPLPKIHDDLLVKQGVFVDSLADPDGFDVLVLVGALPAHLSGPGAILWQRAQSGCRYADLKEACIEALGAHPDADLIVSNTFIQLWREHLLVAADTAD